MSNPTPTASSEALLASITEPVHPGGRLATIVSCIAFLFSGFSLYESVLKQADIEVHVPPVIHYGRDAGGEVELFAVPMTVSNDGARTGTVLSATLVVEDLKQNRRRRYYSAYLGEHQVADKMTKRAFAPASIPGRGVFSETIQFFPEGGAENLAGGHIVQEPGNFKISIKLNLAQSTNPGWLDRLFRPSVTPVVVTMTMPAFSEQALNFRRAAVPMFRPGWTTAPGAKQ